MCLFSQCFVVLLETFHLIISLHSEFYALSYGHRIERRQKGNSAVSKDAVCADACAI